MVNESWHVVVILLLFFLTPAALASDPMAPPYAREKSTGEYSKKLNIKKSTVQGYILRQIVSREKDRSAVVNGYVVNEGSYINNAYVERIKENSVVLIIKSKRKEIILESKLPKIRR